MIRAGWGMTPARPLVPLLAAGTYHLAAAMLGSLHRAIKRMRES